MEDDFLLDAEDDARAVEFIQSYLPQDLKDKFTEDDLYYILDLIAEYYTSSECLDAEPDEEGQHVSLTSKDLKINLRKDIIAYLNSQTMLSYKIN